TRKSYSHHHLTEAHRLGEQSRRYPELHEPRQKKRPVIKGMYHLFLGAGYCVCTPRSAYTRATLPRIIGGYVRTGQVRQELGAEEEIRDSRAHLSIRVKRLSSSSHVLIRCIPAW